MRQLAIILALLLMCVVAHGQEDQLPSVVQGQVGGTSCVFPNHVVSGNTLLIAASNLGTVSTPTDTLSTTFTLVDSNTSTSWSAYVWTGVAGSSGADTISFTTGFRSYCIELPASIGSSVDVKANGSYTGSPSSVTTSSITTTINGDFLFGFISGNDVNGTDFGGTSVSQMVDSRGTAAWKFAGTNGSYSFTFTNRSNANGGYVLLALKPSAIAIATASLPTAALTSSYSYQLQAVGGTGAYTWSVSSGALPAGLSLSSGGVISGTPTRGTTTPTFQVTDGTNTTTAALMLTVNSTPGTVSFIQALSSGSLSSVSVGDCIVAAKNGIGGVVAIKPPTDTRGTVYHLAGSIYGKGTGSAVYTELVVWLGTATASGSDAITDAVAAAQFRDCQSFLDVSGIATGVNAGVVTLTGPTLTTPAPNSMLWAGVSGSSSGSTWNAGSGFTVDTGANSLKGEHELVSSAGSAGTTFAQTANADGGWVMFALALRPVNTGAVAIRVPVSSQVY